jgi:hypothetical protein
MSDGVPYPQLHQGDSFDCTNNENDPLSFGPSYDQHTGGDYLCNELHQLATTAGEVASSFEYTQTPFQTVQSQSELARHSLYSSGPSFSSNSWYQDL